MQGDKNYLTCSSIGSSDKLCRYRTLLNTYVTANYLCDNKYIARVHGALQVTVLI